MKTLLLSVFILAATVAHGQIQRHADRETVADTSDKIEFTTIVEVPNTSDDVLFSRAKEWIADAFRSANDVIQDNDKESGLIVAKGYVDFDFWNAILYVPGKLFFTLKIYVKDGKYKYQIGNFYASAYFEKGGWVDYSFLTESKTPAKDYRYNKRAWRDAQFKAISVSKDFKASLQDYMTKSHDW